MVLFGRLLFSTFLWRSRVIPSCSSRVGNCNFQRMHGSTALIDLSSPHLWYDEARKMQRKVICHVGPTNSGKTFAALKSLSESRSGIYCGPLRLLAWEVSEKLREGGVRCNLLTGNERDFFEEGGTHTSCTIEMADTRGLYDAAVIDEAQLLGDYSRGWAWTEAFFGLRAKEIHLCGSPTMLPIVTNLCKATGDELEVKHYERLSPLVPVSRPVTRLNRVGPGDCVVGFSRKELYEIKRKIERSSSALRCCVIYGSLPPEARREQAKLFNDPASGFNVLVASDAVGMGLNLAIRRIVFSTIEKFDGRRTRKLTSQELKQIAGRAGRFGSVYPTGEVACLRADDVVTMQDHLAKPDKLIQKAGLFPTLGQLQLLSLFVQHKVDHAILSSFWRDFLSREWDVNSELDFNETVDRIMDQGLVAGVIQRYFGSLSNFTSSLTRFVETRDQFSADSRFDVDDTEVVTGTKSVHGKNKSTRKYDKKQWKQRSSIEEALRKDPSSLSNLLQLFRERSTMDGSGFYFMCDLDERAALAAVIDAEPAISFRDKYTLAMTPINVENEKQIRWFRRIVEEFATSLTVSCEYSINPSRLPRNSMDLLDLENAHQIFGAYQWLSYRFPSRFSDMEYAQNSSKLCAEMIDAALKNPESLTFKESRDADGQRSHEVDRRERSRPRVFTSSSFSSSHRKKRRSNGKVESRGEDGRNGRKHVGGGHFSDIPFFYGDRRNQDRKNRKKQRSHM